MPPRHPAAKGLRKAWPGGCGAATLPRLGDGLRGRVYRVYRDYRAYGVYGVYEVYEAYEAYEVYEVYMKYRVDPVYRSDAVYMVYMVYTIYAVYRIGGVAARRLQAWETPRISCLHELQDLQGLRSLHR